ncbi:transcriptional regulator, HxlR family [Pseudoxanthobacter soli DSM 19599]|uniref:Transcriptional regulator, HxlR family n=1 Tax=Pseudoxanthobacter soli DSM 19599 TaxID=1123029 RepID=A0A1M7Z8T9_9HYPH|nr:transcriptional regulator, HxlR family [Pseudoxanthobacter soli DSM 19599]
MARARQSHQESPAGKAMERTLSMIGGKWKGVILHHLSASTLRFNELRRRMPGITQRMLTSQLRELEADGLITRTVYAQVPPRVDYALSPLGTSLASILSALEAWGAAHPAPEPAAVTAAAALKPVLPAVEPLPPPRATSVRPEAEEPFIPSPFIATPAAAASFMEALSALTREEEDAGEPEAAPSVGQEEAFRPSEVFGGSAYAETYEAPAEPDPAATSEPDANTAAPTDAAAEAPAADVPAEPESAAQPETEEQPKTEEQAKTEEQPKYRIRPWTPRDFSLFR